LPGNWCTPFSPRASAAPSAIGAAWPKWRNWKTANETINHNCFVHCRKPDADIYRLALDVAQAAAEEVVYSAMEPAGPCILTINGGSSSIKFALFEAGNALRRIMQGSVERIGLPEAVFRAKGSNSADNFSRAVTAPNHTSAVSALMVWIAERRLDRGRASRGAWRAEV
jgi:hypothetical protein